MCCMVFSHPHKSMLEMTCLASGIGCTILSPGLILTHDSNCLCNTFMMVFIFVRLFSSCLSSVLIFAILSAFSLTGHDLLNLPEVDDLCLELIRWAVLCLHLLTCYILLICYSWGFLAQPPSRCGFSIILVWVISKKLRQTSALWQSWVYSGEVWMVPLEGILLLNPR